MTEIVNVDQAEFWGGDFGDAWVAKQAFFDALLQPALDLVLIEAAPKAGQKVLDVGCGTGASLLALAELVGPSGDVTGVDVSPPMLGMAQERVAEAGLQTVSTTLADAQVHPVAEMAADLVISRFGVMFFEDPYAAFANLATALRPGGTMCFVTWDGPRDNPWFSMPAAAARSLVGDPPKADLRAPGPMAFTERDYVTDILEQAGLQDITARSVATYLTPIGSVAEVAGFAASEGPASRILRDMGGTDADAVRVAEILTEQFEAFQTEDGVRVPAQFNIFRATASA